MGIKFIKYRKIFYGLSIVLFLASLASIVVFGLKLGIDFVGGSSLSFNYEKEIPDFPVLREELEEFNLDNLSIQKQGENGIILRMKNIDEETHRKIMDKLNKSNKIEEGSESFQSIGPVVGEELKEKTKLVIIVALLAILIYVAFSFRKVSHPVKSYIYGFSSLIALAHDFIIPLGVFAFLGKFYGVEITIPIITAFLTVFGYSINDSVVVFDRVRENLIRTKASTFDSVVEKSLNQSLTRSLNTSLTTLLVLLTIFFFGGATLKYFSLTLIIGIALGTYSSLFLATPLLATFYKWKNS